MYPQLMAAVLVTDSVECSNVTNICETTDRPLADKGFDVLDMFAHGNVTVNMLVFFRRGIGWLVVLCRRIEQ